MIDRRFGLPVVLLVFGLLCVLLRAAHIQIGECDIWAKEAAILERSSRWLPYRRGEIRMGGREVLVEDEDRYQISFEWREFRRENPIGQVALANSALNRAPVQFISDPNMLGLRALELLELSPADLASSERGLAADTAFYLRKIVALDRRADAQLRRLMAEPEEERSILSLAVQACEELKSDLRGERAITAHVFERCWSALDDLAQVELLLDRPQGDLMGVLAGRAEDVEEAVAGQMFGCAAGFSAGRLEPDVLAAWDLDWLRESLHWEDDYMAVWLDHVRRGWQRHMLTRIAPGAAIKARQEGPESTLDDLLKALAPTFAPIEGEQSAACEPWAGGPRGWTVSALFDLEGRVAGPGEEPLFVTVQDQEISASWSPTRELFLEPVHLQEIGDWQAAWTDAGLASWEPPVDPAEALARWSEGRLAEQTRLAQWIVVRWALEWQRGWSRYLEPIGADGSPALTAERRKSALDKLDYFHVEQGRRPRMLEKSPAYEAVYLITRYPERFRGFHVETHTRRRKNEELLPGDDPLWRVIGHTRMTNLEEKLIHEGGFEDFRELQLIALRRPHEEFWLQQLVESLPGHDELHGADGVERLMNQTLSGRNGYLEYQSLAELARRGEEGGGSGSDLSPQDGEEVVLTIDLDLQRAASETINHPDPTGDPTHLDEAWFAAPTGAICLITPEGEVLAAASAPNRPGGRPIPFRDGQGAFAHERTLRRYTNLPIGSVFKPFVALWCLEHGLVTADEGLGCVKRERRGQRVPGYRSVDCHSSIGHGHPNLAEALRISCNAYFAQLGDRLGSGEVLVECAQTFGFDRPTGVNRVSSEWGIPEDYESPSFRQAAGFGRSELERGANGLMVLEGTPLQVARAVAGLATGALPSLTFVQGRRAAAPERLPFSRRHLEAVRSALREVPRSGSARLLKEFDIAAKTGSADYAKMPDEVLAQLKVPAGNRPRRKHTWIAGWAPAEDPRLIFVVYLHDIGVTSTHSSVPVARQLLERPEVQAFLAEGGS